MSRIKQSSRARGGTRGGVGGGYEHTNPNYDTDRIRRLRVEYDSLEPRWQETYLKGLSKSDAWWVTHRDQV